MKSVLFVLLATGLVLTATGRLESRGQEKKQAAPNPLKLQLLLEEITVKGHHVFLTGTFRITQPVGGETVSSKFGGHSRDGRCQNRDWGQGGESGGSESRYVRDSAAS
jgi:hypothetical protein